MDITERPLRLRHGQKHYTKCQQDSPSDLRQLQSLLYFKTLMPVLTDHLSKTLFSTVQTAVEVAVASLSFHSLHPIFYSLSRSFLKLRKTLLNANNANSPTQAAFTKLLTSTCIAHRDTHHLIVLAHHLIVLALQDKL